MIGFDLKLEQFKGGFFDRSAVKNAMDKATRRALSRFGAFVRQRARTSIRRRKDASKPGAPPSTQTGLLRRGILFAYESSRRSVVIGPAKLNQTIGNAPEALEKGGPSQILEKVRGKRRVRTVQIRPRPYMQPAYEAELPGLSKLWRNTA